MPNPHPFFTHFPLALLTVGFFVDLAAVIGRKPDWSRYGWWNQVLGTIGLAGTVVTGLVAEAHVVINPEARSTFEIHEQLAFCSAALFAVLLFWRISSRAVVPRKHEVAFLLLYGAGIVALAAGALYGGEIVYTFGVGVRSIRGPG